MNEDHPNFVGYLVAANSLDYTDGIATVQTSVAVYQDPFTRSLTLTAPEVTA